MFGFDATVSAVIAARRLVIQYKRRNNNQLIRPIHIDPVTRPGWAEERLISLPEAAAGICGKNIEVDVFPPTRAGNPLDACVLVYQDRAEIYVSSAAPTYCWRRFLVVKELCHVLMGSAGNYTTIQIDEIARLISEILNGVVRNLSAPLEAEYLAYIAATEVLLPKEFAIDAEQMLANGSEVLDVARVFKVPARVIEWRLKNSETKTLFERVYATHSYANLEFAPVMKG